MSRSLEQRLDALRRNRVSGALDLALEAIALASDWRAQGRPLEELTKSLRTMHPAIAPVANVARLLEEPGADLPSRLQEVRSSLLDGNRRIALNLQQVIPTGITIITLSNSSTVRDALFILEPARVYVMRSLPGGEGEAQAKALRAGVAERDGKTAVEVISDTAIANVVPRVYCALVGIDSYDRGRTILHKVGTLPLALCCRHFEKPLYAAGHSLKRVPQVQPPEAEDEAPELLFDRTPGTLITQIVTEDDEGA